MKVLTDNYKEPLPHIEDEPMNEGQPPGRSDERHKESSGQAARLEHRIGKAVAILLAFHTLVTVSFLVASSFLVHFDRLIPEAKAVLGQLIPFATEPSPVRPGPERSTDLDLTNVTIRPANEASSIIDHVRQSSDASAFKRSKGRRNRAHIPSTNYSGPSPTVEARSPKLIIEPFRLPIGVVVSFEEENGVVRARKLATIPSSWGNAPALRK